MASGTSRVVTGAYTGTGAALSIIDDKVGFKPRKVTIFRATTAIDKAAHVEGMAAASFFKTAAAGARTLVATQGITLQEKGFSLGTDAAINTLGDTYYFAAHE